MDADVGDGDTDLADCIHRGVGEGQRQLGLLRAVVVAAASAATGGEQGGQADQGQGFHGVHSGCEDNPTLVERRQWRGWQPAGKGRARCASPMKSRVSFERRQSWLRKRLSER